MLENHVKFAHEEIVRTADGSNDMSSLLKVMSEQSLNIGEQTKAIGKAVVGIFTVLVSKRRSFQSVT